MEVQKSFPLRVVVADDHRLFRQGLIGLMNTRPQLVDVVGQAATGREAVEKTQELRPDIVLMDIAMPEGSGLQATRTIREKAPDTAVVMLTASDKDEHLQEAVRLGAVGYLLKDLDARELFDLIAGISRGEAAITRTMAARLLKRLADGPDERTDRGENPRAKLTEREVEVLHLVARGVSNREIADTLCITVNTVKSHLQHLLQKLQLENRTQAATYAVQKGLITPFDD